VFLGSSVTPFECLEAGHTDADEDDLSDFCEEQLALAFAPELVVASSHGDPLGREPHWVARDFLGGVRLMYLLSYYADGGTEDPLCENVIGELLCAPHAGDAEWIVLDVKYETSTSHWVLDYAALSQHTTFGAYMTAGTYPRQFSYPTHQGAHPRVWVAYNKHANYATFSECEDSGWAGFDVCFADSYERLTVSRYLNLGSRWAPFANCMYSSNPLYAGNGREECYWYPWRRFHGWQDWVVPGQQTSAYTDILTEWGF
jgi:hypothetical protein